VTEPTADVSLQEKALLEGLVMLEEGNADTRFRASADQADMAVRLAAQVVRRTCNQRDHQCREASTGEPCAHRNHPRDVLYLQHCLAALGLPVVYDPVSGEERKAFLASLRTKEKKARKT